MPDSENIGSVNVSIGADYSPLLQSFQDAQSAASTAGKNISDALTDGAASGANIGQEIASQMSLIQPAAATAVGAIEDFDSAIAAAVSSGMTLNEALASVSASMNTAQTATAGAVSSFEDLQQPVQEGAQQLNLFGDALDSVPWADANGQLNLFTDELEPLEAGLSGASQAAQGTATGVAGVGTAATAATPPINEAGVSLTDFVKGMLALQASLAALAGLKDFASSALDASDSFKTAQVSLANLTGSASQASQTIGQLITLAEQDGLSMPAVLTAATRMQALVGAAAPVPAILAQLANAGSVSGQGIEAAANAFDRIVTSGNAAARTLLPLGISMDDLAKSFNSLTSTSEATNLNVGALLKTLDEPDRVQVLTDALNKLNGTAQQVANETFGGQWNQLIAQWSQVLKSAGDAMAPLLSDLVQLTKTDLVPFAQAAANAFQSFTGTLSTVTGTLSGLIGKFEDLATAIPGAKTAWDAFTDAVSKYNTYSLAKDAINELALGVQTLFGITPGATAMTAAMNAELGKLQSTGTAAKAAIDLVGDSIKALLAADKTTAAQFDTDVSALNAISQSVTNHTAVIKGNVAGLQDQWAALDKVNSIAGQLPEALSSVSLALANDTMAAQKATLSYQAAAGAYQTTLAQFKAGDSTLGALASAFDKMSSAEQAAAAAGAPVAGSFQAIDIQANAAVNSSKILATNFGLVADQAKAQADSIDVLSGAVLVDSQKLDLLVTQEQAVANQVAAGTKQYSSQLAVKQQVSAANAKLISDTQTLQTAELASGNAAADAGGKIAQLAQSQNEANLALDQAKQKYDAGLISTNAYASAQQAAVTATVNLAVAAAEQKANVSGATSELALAGASAAGAAAKLQVLTQAYKDNKASISDVTGAQSAYVSTQVALAEAQAKANTGLQGTTDAYNLQALAVAAAQADVTAYMALEQQGIDVASQLQTAQGNLATQQDKLNKMTVSATADMDALIAAEIKAHGAMGDLPAVMGDVADGLNGIASAAGGAVSQLNDVAAAVQSVVADMQKALGAPSKGVTGAGGAGTTVQQTGIGTFGQGIFSVTETPNVTQKQLQEQVTGGSSPADIAGVEAGMNALGYDDDYSFDWPGGFSGTAEAAMAAQKAGTFNGGSTSAASSSTSTSSTPTASQPLNSTYSGSGSTTTSTPTSSVITGDPAAQAQAVVNALNALSGGGATSALAQQIDKLEDIVLNGGGFTTSQASQLATLLNEAGLNADGTWANGSGGSTGTGAAGASGVPVATTSSSTAADGGVYPDVTAHQAAGEIWAVDTSGIASADTVPADSSGALASAAGDTTDAANATSDAAGDTMTAAQQLSSAAGSLLVVAASFPDLEGTSLNAKGGGGSAAAGGSALPATGGSGYEGTSLNALGGGGSAAAGGAITNLFPSDPTAATAASIAAAQAVETALGSLPSSDAAIVAEIKNLEDIFIKGGGGGLTQAQENQLQSLLAQVGLTPNGTAATPANLPYQPIANLPNYNPVGGPTSIPVNTSPSSVPSSGGSAPSGGMTVNVNINAPGSIGLNTAQVQSQLSAMVVNNLVPLLQTGGARIGR